MPRRKQHAGWHRHTTACQWRSTPTPTVARQARSVARHFLVGCLPNPRRFPVGWWSVGGRLVVSWWSVGGRFLVAFHAPEFTKPRPRPHLCPLPQKNTFLE